MYIIIIYFALNCKFPIKYILKMSNCKSINATFFMFDREIACLMSFKNCLDDDAPEKYFS